MTFIPEQDKLSAAVDTALMSVCTNFVHQGPRPRPRVPAPPRPAPVLSPNAAVLIDISRLATVYILSFVLVI